MNSGFISGFVSFIVTHELYLFVMKCVSLFVTVVGFLYSTHCQYQEELLGESNIHDNHLDRNSFYSDFLFHLKLVNDCFTNDFTKSQNDCLVYKVLD